MKSKIKELENIVSNLNQQIDHVEKHRKQLIAKKELLVEQIRKQEEMFKPINVYCISTMSSGKSTLINAMLGEKLIPAYDYASTASIIRIKDNDKKRYRATAFDKDDNVLEKLDRLDYNIMSRLDMDDNVQEIHIDGDIPFINSKDANLILVDTPGTNSPRNSDHLKTIFKAIENSPESIVLYVINSTQFGIIDDNVLLDKIAKAMKNAGKRSYDRFIFVANKMDSFHPREESIQDALDAVREYLKDKGIENPNIYPASASTALGIKTLLSVLEAKNVDFFDFLDVLDDTKYDAIYDETYDAIGLVRKLNRNRSLHLEEYAPLPKAKKEKIKAELIKAEETNDKNKQALIHSGIPSIEVAILDLIDRKTVADSTALI
ncbi:dynamin family protein [Ligilactobacillus faecis]|uniref:dynamin family protein n=1 Tax=Ligilactobacillus faecis TaxID=762833 RepID=UPI0024696008|nr:dynamin family protein [Ligilactobacillus faecis]WGN89905.1 dynamin family protein [Ligilactobacillus faecis]